MREKGCERGEGEEERERRKRERPERGVREKGRRGSTILSCTPRQAASPEPFQAIMLPHHHRLKQ
jgi:hypothetical protein